MHAWHCGSENTSSAKLHGPRDAYAAYASKLGEIMEKHGRPGIAPAYGGQFSYATGLAYADLMDFGDGDYRLVACYLDMDNCKKPDEPGSYPEDYCVEVWQYSEGNLELAYSGTAQLDGQNTYCGAVTYNVHDSRDYIVTRSGFYAGPSGGITQYAYGLDDSGKFGLITELTNNYSAPDSEYALNGVAVSDAEGEAVAREWFDHENQKSHRLSTIGGSSYPFSLIRDTNTVVTVLEACAA